MARQYFTAEQASELSHTGSTTWTDGVSLSATLDADSDYVIFWGGQFRNSTINSRDYRCRVVDTVANEVFHLANQEPRATSDYFQNGGIAFINSGAGGRSVTLKVQIQSEGASDLCYIRRARLWIIKLDPTKDFWNEALAAQGPIDGLGWVDAVTQTFTPASSNYLLVASCTLQSTSTTAGAYGRITLDSLGSTPGYGAPPNDLTSKVASGYVLIAPGLSGSQTARLQYTDHGGATTGTIDQARLLALNLDEFPGWGGSASTVVSSGTGTSFTDAHTLAYDAADGTHMVLGNWYQGSSSTTAEHQGRLYDDDTGQLSIHERTVINAGAGREIISFTPAYADWAAGSKTLRIQRRMTSDAVANSRITEGATIVVLQMDEASGGPEPLTATGSGTIPLAGSGNSSVAVAAFGNGSLALTGLSAANLAIVGTGASNIDLAGDGTATALITANGAGSIALAGAGAAAVAISAAASGEIEITGTGTAESVSGLTATGAGTFDITGSGAASVGILAAVSGTLAITGAGTAAIASTAVASGNLSLVGAGTGIIRVAGTGSGAIALSGNGSAAVEINASGSGQIDLLGSGTAGAQDNLSAAGAGTIDLAGSGAVSVRVAATGAGSITLAGSGAATVKVSATVAGSIPLGGSGTGAAAITAIGEGALPITGTGTVFVLVPKPASPSRSVRNEREPREAGSVIVAREVAGQVQDRVAASDRTARATTSIRQRRAA